MWRTIVQHIRILINTRWWRLKSDYRLGFEYYVCVIFEGNFEWQYQVHVTAVLVYKLHTALLIGVIFSPKSRNNLLHRMFCWIVYVYNLLTKCWNTLVYCYKPGVAKLQLASHMRFLKRLYAAFRAFRKFEYLFFYFYCKV